MTFEINKDSTSKRIYHLIREKIINLNFVPGLGISEKGISEKFNVSRTPVREAFVRLSQEGLISIYPQKGTFVSLINLSSVEEARFMREHLERAVVRLACEGFPKEMFLKLEMNLKFQEMYMEDHDNKKIFAADEEFHRLIFEGCNKSKIWATINEMESDFQRIRILRLSSNLKWDHIYSQHIGIKNAIINKNPDLAEKIIIEHLTMVNFDKNQLKHEYSNYFK
ncbi:GntR family transcriptional regulator [Clostridium estertheticum]|uniref:GntR family transcriptional regulator n=1 Tax=Clostridium estertheticum TaxID=238834 RepID=UPI001C7E156E|nr:GntR family transcriptional regulator [Clostridium estertheticum]MBX4266679.1 GntR family transcriptional regulator [Clostridium estertheticum]MBX4271228.1 GntR family transcriptional regulator [Clostridium estertheticum]WLC81058.1 GntR family transcriptional regulator [Clostridium estertheticum]WLC88198.1 GntR family transcriptional regulator [Clostridium estertheticum]